MRLTREELLRQYPCWNENRHDIVKAFYGDIPIVIYNQEKYEDYCKLTDNTLKNIECASAYVYSQNGTYFDYRTLIGNIIIAEDGRVLHGSIIIKYQGKPYDVILNKMYGLNALTILRLSSSGVTGWCNKDGQGSPSSQRYTKEMKTEIIEHILKDKLEDYGESVQKFMETVRKTYSEDTSNCIMSKCFSCL
jgi:hypothetical protein